jgi:hypothetical protein
MALAAMNWTEIGVHKVISEFLRAERDRFGSCEQWWPLINYPDLDDPLENHQRLRLFYSVRGPLMFEIPPDTKWYEVHSLTEKEIDEVRVSERLVSQWKEAGNELDKVAAVAQKPLKALPDAWARIILWGHEKTGPFSIIEGNNRLLAWAYAAPRPPLIIPVYVGLSTSLCHWHFADPACSLGEGLFRTAKHDAVIE